MEASQNYSVTLSTDHTEVHGRHTRQKPNDPPRAACFLAASCSPSCGRMVCGDERQLTLS